MGVFDRIVIICELWGTVFGGVVGNEGCGGVGAVVATGAGAGRGATVVVAVSRLVWLVGGDARRMLIAVGVVVVLTVGRTVLMLLI